MVHLCSRKQIQNYLQNKLSSTNFDKWPVPETVKIINDIVDGLDDAENIQIYNTTPLSENEEIAIIEFDLSIGTKIR